MRTRQGSGAIAAMVCASSFVIGLVVVLFLVPDFNQGADYRLAVFNKHKVLMQAWYFVVYVVFALSLVILSRSLLELKSGEHSFLEQIASLVSYLWACYLFTCGFIAILSIEFLYTNSNVTSSVSEVWRQIYNIQMGLGEGVEWVGAIWVVFVNSCLHYKNRFPKSVTIFGFIIAAIGLLTLYNPLAEVGALFGLLQIFWFLTISVLLMKERSCERKSLNISSHQ